MDSRNYMTMRLNLKFDDCIRTNVNNNNKKLAS